MVEEGRLTAVLDWEFAAWGDPHADLGRFCAPSWRFGNRALEAGGPGARRAFLAGCAQEAGRALAAETATAQAALRELLPGETRPLAALARRIRAGAFAPGTARHGVSNPRALG